MLHELKRIKINRAILQGEQLPGATEQRRLAAKVPGAIDTLEAYLKLLHKSTDLPDDLIDQASDVFGYLKFSAAGYNISDQGELKTDGFTPQTNPGINKLLKDALVNSAARLLDLNNNLTCGYNDNQKRYNGTLPELLAYILPYFDISANDAAKYSKLYINNKTNKNNSNY